MKEAMFYETLSEGSVRCALCNHHCKIKDGKRGLCGVRENHDGRLYSLVYGKMVAEHIDPIEKKPLFHFFPGSAAYSIGTMGCNFRCTYCQNFEISQYPRENGAKIIGESVTSEEIVSAAKAGGCQSIAYTYTEPTIFYEFAYDTAVLAQKEGIRNVFVSNGYMSKEAAKHLAPYLDAINIDLKSFTETFYKEICGARLEPVLETIQLMRDLGVWVEVTNLIIPDLNDAQDNLQAIARFLKGVGEVIPWHITRFYPAFKLLNPPPTPVQVLRQTRKMGLDQGLRYVYGGNLPGDEDENTYCYNCGAVLIRRRNLSLEQNLVEKGKCPECGKPIDGVGL